MVEQMKFEEKQKVLEAVYNKYLKVIRVELNKGEYEVLKGDVAEESIGQDTHGFVDYMNRMVDADILCEEDVQDFLVADKLSELSQRISKIDYNTKR